MMANKENKSQKQDSSTNARDDKKRLQSDDDSSQVLSTGNKQRLSTMTEVTKVSKRPLYIVAVIVLLLLTAGWILVARPFEKPLAQVDGHRIYKQDTEQLTSKNKEVNTKDAAVVLADKYLTEAMAKQQGVTVSQQDLEQEYGQDISKLKNTDPYTYQANVNGLYFSKLSGENQGAYKGKLLVAHFSRNVAYQSPLLAEKKERNPTLGDTSAIAADKKAAKDFIVDLHSQIESGKITFDDAIKIERANPIVGETAYPTLSHSGPFDTSTNEQNSILNTESIRDAVRKMKAGTTTKPFVVRVANSSYDNSTAESFYLVIKMDTSKGGNSKVSFEQQLENAKKQLGYKINV